MYSSLLKIDIVADAAPGCLFVLTDHRTAAEMADEAEVTVLFALTRVLNARKYAVDSGKDATIVYACMEQPAPELLEALAATGAQLDVDHVRTKLAPVTATPAELADRAFSALAKRVRARVGLTDWAATLHAVEAETLAEGLDAEEDEISYWIRVVELAAVTGEVMRARDNGRWIECDRADVPFGFARTNGDGADSMISLPTNRAARFIADGESESMFYLLESHDEAPAHDDGVILPSLRRRSDAIREKMLFRPLFERAPDGTEDDLPVIAYGTDGERTFGLITADHSRDPAELHETALANIATQKVNVDRVDIAGVDVAVVSDSYFATEKLLDRAFMLGLHRDLGELLAVATPCRGLMFVTNAAPSDPLRAMALLRAIIDKESQTTRSIATAILLVQHGEVVGHVRLSGSDEAPPPPPRKKPGFFRRLFGGGQA